MTFDKRKEEKQKRGEIELLTGGANYQLLRLSSVIIE